MSGRRRRCVDYLRECAAEGKLSPPEWAFAWMCNTWAPAFPSSASVGSCRYFLCSFRKQNAIKSPKMTFYLRLSEQRGQEKYRVCILRKCRRTYLQCVWCVVGVWGPGEGQDEHTVWSHMLWRLQWKTLQEPWILLGIRRGQLSHTCSHTMAQSQHSCHMSELGLFFFSFVFFFKKPFTPLCILHSRIKCPEYHRCLRVLALDVQSQWNISVIWCTIKNIQ